MMIYFMAKNYRGRHCMNNATSLYEFTVTRVGGRGDGSGVMEGGIGREEELDRNEG
jgi:hypothetical protein